MPMTMSHRGRWRGGECSRVCQVGERERKSSVLEVSVGDAAVVEVVDGIEDGMDTVTTPFKPQNPCETCKKRETMLGWSRPVRSLRPREVVRKNHPKSASCHGGYVRAWDT